MTRGEDGEEETGKMPAGRRDSGDDEGSHETPSSNLTNGVLGIAQANGQLLLIIITVSLPSRYSLACVSLSTTNLMAASQLP